MAGEEGRVLARLGCARYGRAGEVRLVVAGTGWFGRGRAAKGMAGGSRWVAASFVASWRGMAGKAGMGELRLVAALLGWAGEGRLVVERCGKEVLGMVWQAGRVQAGKV
jgi:hypothetical protein